MTHNLHKFVPLSLYILTLKMAKIQRENILKRPVLSMFLIMLLYVKTVVSDESSYIYDFVSSDYLLNKYQNISKQMYLINQVMFVIC